MSYIHHLDPGMTIKRLQPAGIFANALGHSPSKQRLLIGIVDYHKEKLTSGLCLPLQCIIAFPRRIRSTWLSNSTLAAPAHLRPAGAHRGRKENEDPTQFKATGRCCGGGARYNAACKQIQRTADCMTSQSLGGHARAMAPGSRDQRRIQYVCLRKRAWGTVKMYI